MIRILIVDDHASIRDSFRSAFEQYDDLKVVGSVADAVAEIAASPVER